jgi:hypothetical protein
VSANCPRGCNTRIRIRSHSGVGRHTQLSSWTQLDVVGRSMIELPSRGERQSPEADRPRQATGGICAGPPLAARRNCALLAPCKVYCAVGHQMARASFSFCWCVSSGGGRQLPPRPLAGACLVAAHLSSGKIHTQRQDQNIIATRIVEVVVLVLSPKSQW